MTPMWGSATGAFSCAAAPPVDKARTAQYSSDRTANVRARRKCMAKTGLTAREGMAEPALYVVATPIGNLADISLRALEVLRSVDVVAAEDTRVTQHLLSHHGIGTRLLA